MLPPPEQSYSTREELLDNAKRFAITEGYAVTIKRSDKGVSFAYRIVVATPSSLAESQNREARGT